MGSVVPGALANIALDALFVVVLGQAKVSLFIALPRKVILLIPLALVLPRFWGVMGVFAAEGIADGTAALICTAIFWTRFPKILRKREREGVRG